MYYKSVGTKTHYKSQSNIQSLHTCILAYFHTCKLAYLHTCILAYLHTCIPAYLHTCIPAYLHSLHSLHTCILAYFAYLHTYIFAYTCTSKTPSSHHPDTFQTTSRRLCQNFKTPLSKLPDTSRYLLDTFQTLSRHLPDTFQTPSRHFQTHSRHIPDTFQTSFRHLPGTHLNLHIVSTSQKLWNSCCPICKIARFQARMKFQVWQQSVFRPWFVFLIKNQVIEDPTTLNGKFQ